MFGFLKRGAKKFDRKTLRKNDISLLILDERWNHLFENTNKTPEIIKCETALKEILKKQSRLLTKEKEIASSKKEHLDNIIQLTTEVYEKNNPEAAKKMQCSQNEITCINNKMKEIAEDIEEIPSEIKEANLMLLEQVVNVVYFKIRACQKRVQELEKLIEETREKLKEYIDEKETLSQDDTEIYAYFHDLLGAEELEKLDKEYFKD